MDIQDKKVKNVKVVMIGRDTSKLTEEVGVALTIALPPLNRKIDITLTKDELWAMYNMCGQ